LDAVERLPNGDLPVRGVVIVAARVDSSISLSIEEVTR
jgi:hypothetical protein